MRAAYAAVTLALLAWGLVVIIQRVDENGWGSLVWLASLVATYGVRAFFSGRNRLNTIVKQRRQDTERLLLLGLVIGSVVLPIVSLTGDALGFADYQLPDWATALGAALLVPAFWLLWRSHADLGRNWSSTVELREGQTLTTSGVYKRVRHPMYAAGLLTVLCAPFLIHNWIAGFSGAVAFGLLYIIRVPYEEEMMRDQFGQAYDDYSNRTGRLWPRLRGERPAVS